MGDVLATAGNVRARHVHAGGELSLGARQVPFVETQCVLDGAIRDFDEEPPVESGGCGQQGKLAVGGALPHHEVVLLRQGE